MTDQALDKTTARRISKFMSLVLRHDPGAAGLELDENGWCDLGILSAFLIGEFPVTDAQIHEIIATSDKQRFVLRDGRIRANQGHSVDVDLALNPQTPPELLYHGTNMGIVVAIRDQGLIKRSRQHVHLSTDEQTAITVARRRRGPHVILKIAARNMHRDRHLFYCSENGIWLTDHVPPTYIQFPSDRTTP